MRPDRFHEDEDSGQDSFLDVVANVVGVLIILVMLVGMQASQSLLVAESEQPMTPSIAAVESPPQHIDLSELQDELDEGNRQAHAANRENKELTVKLVKLTLESAAKERRRAELGMHRAVLEEDIEKRRNKLDASKQREFDVQRQLFEAQIKLDEMTKEQLTLAMAPTAAEEIECVPTPLAKTVEGESIHLRLHKGLVSIVPFEELMHEVENRFADIRRRLQSRNQVAETIGPLNGYRLRFTVSKRSSAESVGGPRAGQIQRAAIDWSAQVLPVSDEIGQNVEQALMPGSTLHSHLNSYQRQMPTVVIWLYTDSFNEFRPLKRALWEMGASVAVRPMQPGSLIGASPHGTKSAAQ